MADISYIRDGSTDYQIVDLTAIHGSGTQNYIAKFTSAKELGTTGDIPIGNDTTKFLRNDGTWATPTGTFTLSVAKYNLVGGVKPWKSYTVSCTGPTAAEATTAVTVNSISTTSGKYYAVEIDKDGRLFVNVPWSDNDTKVTVAQATTNTFYPILATGAGTATRQIDTQGFKYEFTAGTTSTAGKSILVLGNAIGTGSANNEEGILRIFGALSTYSTDIKFAGAYSGQTVYLPSPTAQNETAYLVSTTTNGTVGSNTNPIYLTTGNHLTASEWNIDGAIRFINESMTPSGGATTFSTSHILGGFTVIENNILVDDVLQIWSVSSISGTAGGVSILGSYKLKSCTYAKHVSTDSANNTLVLPSQLQFTAS